MPFDLNTNAVYVRRLVSVKQPTCSSLSPSVEFETRWPTRCNKSKTRSRPNDGRHEQHSLPEQEWRLCLSLNNDIRTLTHMAAFDPPLENHNHNSLALPKPSCPNLRPNRSGQRVNDGAKCRLKIKTLNVVTLSKLDSFEGWTACFHGCEVADSPRLPMKAT